MPRHNYPAQSPYADTNQTAWYLLPITLRTINPDSSDQLIAIEPRYEFRPDLMSYYTYGSPAYWWVFSVRNMDIIRDPIWDFKANQ